jgi:translation elongation factor EF-1alpha
LWARDGIGCNFCLQIVNFSDDGTLRTQNRIGLRLILHVGNILCGEGIALVLSRISEESIKVGEVCHHVQSDKVHSNVRCQVFQCSLHIAASEI